jgi:hypothetical protein
MYVMVGIEEDGTVVMKLRTNPQPGKEVLPYDKNGLLSKRQTGTLINHFA